ncbi:MAG: hypothetical protein IE926_02680 [Micrococcales bacterium]|nr:hypothetical protein [Micrococcales bacterium]
MSGSVEFIGGMNVPATFGRANASHPLAILCLDDLRLALRPRYFAKLMMTPYEVALTDIEVAFEATGKLRSPAVGLRMRDGTMAYFWTASHRQQVLSELERRGVRIEPGTLPARQQWSLRSARQGSAVSGIPRPLVRLIPAITLASLGLLVLLITLFPSWPMRLGLVAVWTLSTMTNLRVWWRSRPGPDRAEGTTLQ